MLATSSRSWKRARSSCRRFLLSTAVRSDVFLKERRKLIVVPRETPWNLIHARNIVTLLEAGAVVLPAIPSFYSRQIGRFFEGAPQVDRCAARDALEFDPCSQHRHAPGSGRGRLAGDSFFLQPSDRTFF